VSITATSAQMLAFPPYYSLWQVEIADQFLFGLLLGPTKFIRETTTFERAVGVSDTHALVKKSESGITRVYGHAISLNRRPLYMNATVSPRDDTETCYESLVNDPQIKAILQSCPIAGDGVNRWLFGAALKLHRLKIDPEMIEELLEEATDDCGRAMKPDEIERAVRNSDPKRLKDRPWRRKWPERNYEQIEAIGLDGIRLSGLEQQSPVRLAPGENHAETIIDSLFPGDPLLCACPSLKFVLTRPRKEWSGFLSRQQFIVPSAMIKRKGRTQDGKLSARSLENVGPRQFLVVEFDFTETDENGRLAQAAPMLRRLAAWGVSVFDLCAAIHAELADVRPLALVVHSGGKSLHGWYPCGEHEEDLMHRFMRFAVSLGADPATWTKIQLVRMPEGLRDNGKRQRVLYFNPAVLNGGGK